MQIVDQLERHTTVGCSVNVNGASFAARRLPRSELRRRRAANSAFVMSPRFPKLTSFVFCKITASRKKCTFAEL